MKHLRALLQGLGQAFVGGILFFLVPAIVGSLVWALLASWLESSLPQAGWKIACGAGLAVAVACEVGALYLYSHLFPSRSPKPSGWWTFAGAIGVLCLLALFLGQDVARKAREVRNRYFVVNPLPTRAYLQYLLEPPHLAFSERHSRIDLGPIWGCRNISVTLSLDLYIWGVAGEGCDTDRERPGVLFLARDICLEPAYPDFTQQNIYDSQTWERYEKACHGSLWELPALAPDKVVRALFPR